MKRNLFRITGNDTLFIEDVEYFAIIPTRIDGKLVWLKWVHECRKSANGIDFTTISKEVINDPI